MAHLDLRPGEEGVGWLVLARYWSLALEKIDWLRPAVGFGKAASRGQLCPQNLEYYFRLLGCVLKIQCDYTNIVFYLSLAGLGLIYGKFLPYNSYWMTPVK